MNTANGAQAQIWNYVAGGNQEWTLERIDDVAQTGKRAGEAKDPSPPPSQRKHQNDLVRKLNSAGKGRAGRKGINRKCFRCFVWASAAETLPKGCCTAFHAAALSYEKRIRVCRRCAAAYGKHSRPLAKKHRTKKENDQ